MRKSPPANLAEALIELPPERAQAIRSILKFRTLLHAHAYTPFLSIILFAFVEASIAGQTKNDGWLSRAPEAVVGILAAVGSVAFGLSKFFTGRHADLSSPFDSVCVGLKWMIGSTALGALACWIASALPNGGLLLIVVSQVFTGIGLGFIDVADSLMLYRELKASGILIRPLFI